MYTHTLEDTIRQDCVYWGKFPENWNQYLCLNVCKDSEQSGLYQLILNGRELWYGTLPEINAVMKTMIYRIEKADEYSV